jgi:hypothetical protein
MRSFVLRQSSELLKVLAEKNLTCWIGCGNQLTPAGNRPTDLRGEGLEHPETLRSLCTEIPNKWIKNQQPPEGSLRAGRQNRRLN